MSNSFEFYIYTDGSYINHGREKSGVGFVILDKDGKQHSEGSLGLGGKANSSSLAEIYAAVIALRSIETQSTILLVSDDKTLCHTIENKRFEDRINHALQRPFLKAAYEDLRSIVAFHFAVSAQHKPRKSTPEMITAHKLAQEGTLQPVIFSPS